MTLSIEISRSTARALDRLTGQSTWIGKSPGGLAQPTAEGDLFRVSTLLLDGAEPVLITAETIEVGTHVEVFRVAARVPTERDREMTRPPFSPISAAADLRISVASRGPLDVFVLADRIQPDKGAATEGQSVDVALLIENGNGDGLLIDTRCDRYSTAAIPVSPLDLILTTSASRIRQSATALERRRVLTDAIGDA